MDAESVLVPVPLLTRPPVPETLPLTTVLPEPLRVRVLALLLTAPLMVRVPAPLFWNDSAAPRVILALTCWLVPELLTIPPLPLVKELPLKL